MKEYTYYHVQANGLIFGTNELINISIGQTVDWTNSLENTSIVLANLPSHELAQQTFAIAQSAKNG